jgi:long-chain fatty acid transport protein
MKYLSLTHASIAILGSALSGMAFSNGFALNEQSARSLGQAFSGRVSDADNASTVASNPAGMSRLKQAEFAVGAAFIDAHSDISDTSAAVSVRPSGPTFPRSGSNDGDMIPGITIPFAYYVHPIDEHWSVGFGVFTEYGLKNEYEDTFQGRYLGIKSELQTVTAQPTASYKFENNLSIGVGVTYNTVDGELSKAIFTGPATSDRNASVEGDDSAWGYNLGALYEINSATRVGVAYYSKVDYSIEGHTEITGVPRLDASLDLTTPDKLDFGLTHDFTSDLTLHVDITHTNWSELTEIEVHNETSLPQLATDTENLDWDDTWSYAVGLSYQINPEWTVRSGIGIDPSPIKSSTRSVRVPVDDREQIAFGATWSPTETVSIDLAYLYFRESTAHINITQPGATVNNSYSGKYENSANIFGVQLNWKI